jgi:hypothetical protein
MTTYYIFGLYITIFYLIYKLYQNYKINFYSLFFQKNNKNIKSKFKTIKKKNNYIIEKPKYFNYIKMNKQYNINFFLNKDKIKNLVNNKSDYKIIKVYIYNKKKFTDFFINDNTYIIKNLLSLNDLKKNEKNYNIFFKFYNFNEYLYIVINNNLLIKIINNNIYDTISNLIENNINAFLIQDIKNNKNFITYGDYINCINDKKNIKKIFFNNCKKNNKNFEILNKFNHVKIFFYVSTEKI